MVTLFLTRPMRKDEIWACQRHASNQSEEELGWKENKEEEDGHRLPWFASSKLESLKHSGNFLQEHARTPLPQPL